jgi:hypothetical protein
MTIVSTGSLTLKDMNDAKQLSMFIGASQSKTVIYNGVSTYTPDYSSGSTNQVLTPQVRIAGGSTVTPKATRWYYQTNGAGTVTQISTSGTPTGHTLGGTQPITLTVSTNIMASNTSMTYICEADYDDPDTGFTITAKAEIEIVKVTNGTSSVTSFLTNSSVTLPATNAGAVSVFTGSGTDIYVYDGTNALQFLTSGTAGNGQFTISASVSPASGVTLATPTAGTSPNRAVYGNITAFATANDVVTVTYTITGKTSAGTAISGTVIQTFTKAKMGAGGNDATVYWLSSPAVVQMSPDKVYTPATITVSGYSQTGTGTAGAYSGRFKIYESTDGSTFGTATYTSSANESSKTYTPTAQATSAIKAIKVEMYLAGGTTTKIDEQIIPIVADGTSSIYTNVWTPDGNAIQNSTGQLTVKADIYDGIDVVAGSAYKWYIQNPSATTSSLGDADGGNGWELLTNVADPTTNATLTAPTTAGSTLTAGTYYIKYTWITKVGESKGSSTQQTQATTAGQGLNVQVPVFPSGVTGAKVYVGSTTGDANLYYQGDINVSNGSLLIKTPIVTSGSKVPTVANTARTNLDTLYVQAWGIQGMEGFKAVVTYNSVKYSGVTTVQDLSDPILVTIDGVDTFKNGTGTTILNARLWQNGAEIDSSGTIYTYTWAMYNPDGSQITPAYSTLNTGKSVTVDGRDVNARASIICEISK